MPQVKRGSLELGGESELLAQTKNSRLPSPTCGGVDSSKKLRKGSYQLTLSL